MATAIRQISHEDRLSLVDHLDELRTRLIVSGIALAIAFGFCLWQNHALLHLINKPLERQSHKQVVKCHGPEGQIGCTQQGVLKLAHTDEALLSVLVAPKSGLSATARAQLAGQIKALKRDVEDIPKKAEGDKPVTLGIGEPFTTTITVTLIFALIVSLPLILYEIYGFIMPAFKPEERRAVRGPLFAVPFLFATGVLFGYFVVLPAAVRFFVNFNSEQFNVLVQAAPYYKFAATILLAMGLVFQVPVVILGAVRAGIVTPPQLRKGRRYAVLACAAIAAFLPGDAITLILETVPLYILYEASILIASFADRRASSRARASAAAQQDDPPASPPPPPPENPPESPPPAPRSPGEASVEELIDHFDRELS
jgi:sec-independent protein translocase protein TatC